MTDMYRGKLPFLLFSLGLLLVQLLHGALGLIVTNTLSNSRPRLGETITLNCSIDDGVVYRSQRVSVAWWKDRESLVEAVYVSYRCLVVPEQYKSRLTNIQCDKHHYNFQLINVKGSDSGKWQCEADASQANTVLDLDVLVPHNVRVKINKTTVKEDEFVRFECVTSGGNPEFVTRYQWLWKKSGSDAEQVIQDTPNEKFLELTNIQYNRSGLYSCKAWNDGGVGQASTVLNVQYSPRIDPEAKMKYEVAGHVGGEALFQLFIIANPTPVATGYTWSRDGNDIPSSSQDYEITRGPTFSKFKIKAVKPSDYQNYSCSVKTSGFPAKVFNFHLLKPDPLPAPSRLKEVTSTAVSATLEWISESPNGTEQRFYVQYKKSPENWDNALEVPQEGITDPGLKQVVHHEIEDLKPNVSYVFRVGSKVSQSGPFISNFSNIVVIKTQDSNYGDKPKHYIHDAVIQTGFIVLIVGGVVVVILVVIVVIAIILNRKRPSSMKNGEAQELPKASENNAESGNIEHLVPAHGALGNEPTSSGDDEDAYEYVASPVTRQQGGSGDVLMSSGDDVDVYDYVNSPVISQQDGSVNVPMSSADDVDVYEYVGCPVTRQQDGSVNEPQSSLEDDEDEYEYVSSSMTRQQVVSVNVPASSGNDADVYEYVNWSVTRQQGGSVNVPKSSGDDTDADVGSSTTGQEGISCQSQIPAWQANQRDLEDATPYKIMQMEQEAEFTYQNLIILSQEQPSQGTAESGAMETNGTQELTPSCSSHGGVYTPLDLVEVTSDGTYLDFLQQTPEQSWRPV